MLRIYCNHYEKIYESHFELKIDKSFDSSKIFLKILRDNYKTIIKQLLYKNFLDPSNTLLYNFSIDYINLCIFASSSIKEEGKDENEIIKERVSSIANIKNIPEVDDIRKNIDDKDYSELFKDKKNYDDFKGKIVNGLEYINGKPCVGKEKYRTLFENKIKIKVIDKNKKYNKFRKFNYGCLNKEIKAEYFKSLGIETCPYCNHNFIQTLKDKSVCNTFDIDHFYPKSDFPLLSLSLYNFVPSCKICNQLFKSDNCNSNEMINPNVEGFGDDAIFKVLDSMDGSYEVKVKIINPESTKGKKCRYNVDLFRLEKLYEGRQNYINDIMTKKRNYSKDVIFKIKEVLASNDLPCSDEVMNKLLYGITLDEKDDKLYILSKFTRDIVINGDK